MLVLKLDWFLKSLKLISPFVFKLDDFLLEAPSKFNS